MPHLGIFVPKPPKSDHAKRTMSRLSSISQRPPKKEIRRQWYLLLSRYRLTVAKAQTHHMETILCSVLRRL